MQVVYAYSYCSTADGMAFFGVEQVVSARADMVGCCVYHVLEVCGKIRRTPYCQLRNIGQVPRDRYAHQQLAATIGTPGSIPTTHRTVLCCLYCTLHTVRWVANHV